jgi:glutamyl/glutaminyl-tRNA synthetase
VAIYQAFGWKVPEFAHLSTILGADRERLSKRHGATSINSFREMGYLPEALVNYLALLGWGAEDGKSETFTLEELTRVFSLERVTPSPAVFDFDKLNWLNRHYLKLAAPERILGLCLEGFRDVIPLTWTLFVVSEGPNVGSIAGHLKEKQWFEQLIATFLPSVDRLSQLRQKASPVLDFNASNARTNSENIDILAAESAQKVIADLACKIKAHSGPVSPEAFKAWMSEVKVSTGVKGKELFHPVRIALTGAHSGPEFDKLIPLIEDGAELGLQIPTIRQRIEMFLEN